MKKEEGGDPRSQEPPVMRILLLIKGITIYSDVVALSLTMKA